MLIFTVSYIILYLQESNVAIRLLEILYILNKDDRIHKVYYYYYHVFYWICQFNNIQTNKDTIIYTKVIYFLQQLLSSFK